MSRTVLDETLYLLPMIVGLSEDCDWKVYWPLLSRAYWGRREKISRAASSVSIVLRIRFSHRRIRFRQSYNSAARRRKCVVKKSRGDTKVASLRNPLGHTSSCLGQSLSRIGPRFKVFPGTRSSLLTVGSRSRSFQRHSTTTGASSSGSTEMRDSPRKYPGGYLGVPGSIAPFPGTWVPGYPGPPESNKSDKQSTRCSSTRVPGYAVYGVWRLLRTRYPGSTDGSLFLTRTEALHVPVKRAKSSSSNL
eukprot:2352892-Rhodomonas_salina.1